LHIPAIEVGPGAQNGSCNIRVICPVRLMQLKTAYLVLAHHQPDHLAKLVGCLDHVDGVFFIHTDLKADEGVFRNALGERRNVVFIKDRYTVNWGGFSQVEATLALLSAAFAFRPSFHRYCLLSGSDYPIKSNCLIQAEFASGREFLRIDRKVGSGEHNGHCRNVTSYWFMDSMDPAMKASSGSVRRDPYKLIGLYHGAQWWALTRDCVEYVLRFLASDPDYLTFFRYTLCPDEIFFHSIVKHSPFASQISHDFEMTSDRQRFSLSNEHGCHYIDWNAKREDKLPKILDLADLDVLLASQALFARKFQGPRSTPLLSRLEESFREVTPR
jgi:hypothetical protein